MADSIINLNRMAMLKVVNKVNIGIIIIMAGNNFVNINMEIRVIVKFIIMYIIIIAYIIYTEVIINIIVINIVEAYLILYFIS